MDSAGSYIVALLFALLVHGVVIGLMSMNWNQSTMRVSEIEPYYIDASLVSSNPFADKVDAAQNARDEKIKQRRSEEARLRAREQQLQRDLSRVKKPPPVTQIPLPEPRPVPQSVERQSEPKAVDQEAARSSFEDELALALVDETNLRAAVTDDEKAMAYVAQIQREIVQNWSRPPSARNGMQALLRVHLVPTGEVVDVQLEQSSGNDAFDRSAMLAVRKSDRFVVPSDALRFERDFREFTVLFRPDDLRL